MDGPSGRTRSRRRRLLSLLAGIALVSIVVRLWALGDRVAHWDEARIAFWVLQYGATGQWTYHPVFHGPLLFHVERWLFAVLGPSDVTMRLPTAIVGGLLPLAAWLFRDHLDDTEVLAMAGLLAANPILVYYSRFMRNDILVAAFSLLVLGLGLRWLATRRLRYAIGIGVFLGAALGSKENALLYLLAWTGAFLLFLSLRARITNWTVRSAPSAWSVRSVASLRTIGHTMVSGIAGLTVLVWIYAPRGRGAGTLGAFTRDPGTFPTVFEAAILGPPAQAISFWALGSAQGEYPYHVFFGLLVGILFVGAGATVLLAGIGLLRHHTRPLVSVAGLWAGLSVIGYPAAADLMAGWTVLHVVVPLTIPAAVGLVSITRDPPTVSQKLPGSRPVVALLVIYLVVSVGLTSFVAPGSAYNPIGQPSQMGEGAGETLDAMQTRLEGGGSVAYVGADWESIIQRLPMLWYVQRTGAERVFVESVDGLDGDPPAVLITHANRRPGVDDRYPTYDCRAHERVPWEGGRPEGKPGSMLVCVDTS